MLSRFGPLGLSVLALVASFVIVFTGGLVFATDTSPTHAPSGSATPAPQGQTPAHQAQPRTLTLTVSFDTGQLQPGDATEIAPGVTLRASRGPAPATTAGGAVKSSDQPAPSVTRLCVTVTTAGAWTMSDPGALWHSDGDKRCLDIDRPQRVDITLQGTL
jgi:hypothetical protein